MKIFTLGAILAVFAATGCASEPRHRVVTDYGAVTAAPPARAVKHATVGAEFRVVNAINDLDGPLKLEHGRIKRHLRRGESIAFRMSYDGPGVTETSVTVTGRKNGKFFSVTKRFTVGCQDGWLGGRDCRWRSYTWTVTWWDVLRSTFSENTKPEAEKSGA